MTRTETSNESAATVAKLLAGLGRSELFLEFPHQRYGKLRLDVLDAEVMRSLTERAMTDEMVTDAEQRFQRGRELFDADDPTPSVEAMREITRLYPLWGGGHGALYDVCKHLGRYEDALYHLSQLIALQPEFDNLCDLGVLLGRLERLEDSATVLEHLLTIQHEAPSQESALDMVFSLLVTLTRQHRGAEMVKVADDAVARYGARVDLVYQGILGLILSKRTDEARQRLSNAIPNLPPNNPLETKFAEMKQMLGLD